MVDARDLMNPFVPIDFGLMLCVQILSEALKVAVSVAAEEE